MIRAALTACLFFLAACAPAAGPATPAAAPDAGPAAGAAVPPVTATAVFAGGCFWCMEPPFDRLPGVIATTSGFSGGTVANPTYRQVTAGGTGHLEVVEVRYDPARISYSQLLEVYWRQIDPFDGGGQFCDRGESYRPAIFAATPQERAAAEASADALAARFGRPLAVTVEAAAPFWPAEAYHQDYYLENPARYRFYRSACGRDARLQAIWGAPSP